MTGYDFEYNGNSLRDMGFIMVRPDDEDNFGLSRTVIKGNITPFKSTVPHFGTQYNDVLILNFFIIKNVTENYKNTKVTYYELRDIQAWLTSPKLPQSLYIDSYDNEKVIEYVGLFTDVTAFQNDHLNGLKLTFTCNSQYGYEYSRWVYKINSTDGVVKKIYNETDEFNEVVYPIFTISPTTTGEFSITNNSTDESINITFDDTATYTIDCKLRRILKDGSPVSLSSIGWNVTELVDQNDVGTGTYLLCWLPIYPGMNSITIKGNATLTIEYKTPLKVGGYINV